MKIQLRKTIILPISTYEKSDEVIINVSWDILEKVERVFGTSAEYVATQILPNIFHVQRNKISQVLQAWCQGKTELKQIDIAEAVQTASQDQFYQYIGMIQAAILWSIRGADGRPMISDENFDKLIAGQDLEPEAPIENPPAQEKKTPKKKVAATSKKPTA